tara:strand:- start:2258 stop:2488 length:231 start_codon:yes stop_codon:yes gene_type:complete
MNKYLLRTTNNNIINIPQEIFKEIKWEINDKVSCATVEDILEEENKPDRIIKYIMIARIKDMEELSTEHNQEGEAK